MSKNFNAQTDPLLNNNRASSNQLEDSEEKRYLEGETEESDDIYTNKLSDEAKKMTDTSQAAEEIKTFVESNTGEAASYVRSMMSGVLDAEANS